MAKPKRRPARARSRAGMLPGEYRRKSLVQVEALTGLDADRPLRDMERIFRPGAGDLKEPHNFIVETHRLDGLMTSTIEYRGERWFLPGKVIEALIRQRESIISEDRRSRAKDQADRRARAVHDADQQEAALADEPRPEGA